MKRGDAIIAAILGVAISCGSVSGSMSALAAESSQRKAVKTYTKKKKSSATTLGTITPKTLGAKLEQHKFYNKISSLNVLSAEIAWAKGMAAQVIRSFDAKYPAKKSTLDDLQKLEEYRGTFVSYWANKAGTTVEMYQCSSLEWCYAKMTTYFLYSELADKATDDAQKSAIFSMLLAGEAMNANNGSLISTLFGFGAAGGSLQSVLEIDGMVGSEQEWHNLLGNIISVMEGRSMRAPVSMPQALQMLDAEVQAQRKTFIEDYSDFAPYIVEEMVPSLDNALANEKSLTDEWGASLDKIFAGDSVRSAQAANATIVYIKAIADLANSSQGDV